MTARSLSGVEAACCVVEDRVSGKRPENRGQRGLREARGASSKSVGSGRNGGKYISQSKKRLREEGKKKEVRARNASDGEWEVWNRCPFPYLCWTIGRPHELV